MSFKLAEVIFLWNCLNWGVSSVYVSVVDFIGLEPGGIGRDGGGQ